MAESKLVVAPEDKVCYPVLRTYFQIDMGYELKFRTVGKIIYLASVDLSQILPSVFLLNSFG